MSARVLHVYGDYKWTGPSGPVARLAHALSREGWHSTLACSRAPKGDRNKLAARAAEMGLEVDSSLHLDSSPNLTKNLADRRRLRQMVRDGGYDVVHCHGSWDHFLCAWALGRKREVPLIRSDHSGREYGSNPLHKWFYGPRMSDRLLVISDRFRTQAVDRAGRTAETVVTVRGAVDTRQYEPEAPPPNTRSQYGLAEADFVIGIVARVQPHRHWDELLEAARIVQQQKPRIKIVVLGRGTRKKRLLDDPVKDLGLQDTVFPLGYLREGYIDALNMFDSGMLLVPGSDGTCRAAMEMAALQKPMLVGRAGVLPEIVVDGRTGIVVPHSGQKLAEAMMTLAEMPVAERLAWGRAGRERLEKWFCLERQVETVIGVYTDLVG